MCSPLLLLQPDDKIENEVRIFAVEIAGRFVRQHQRGAVGQAARDRDTLAFAARQLRWKMIKTMVEPDQLKQFNRSLFSVSETERSVSNIGSLHILRRGKGRQELEGLKNEANFVSAISGWIGMIGKRFPTIQKRPGRGPGPAPRAFAVKWTCRIRSGQLQQ